VLGGLPRERFLDQYFAWREKVFEAAEDPAVIAALEQAVERLSRTPEGSRAIELIQLELRAFKSAVDVAFEEQPTSADAGLSIRERLAGIGSRTVDSVSDILEDLIKKNPLAFATLKALSELLGFFGRR
jgi:hypothetical protein